MIRKQEKEAGLRNRPVSVYSGRQRRPHKGFRVFAPKETQGL